MDDPGYVQQVIDQSAHPADLPFEHRFQLPRRGGVLRLRREGVTDAAGKLHRLGVIRYARGKITVLDRPQLEALCCECYAVVKKESDRLLPLPAPKPAPRALRAKPAAGA
jgi:hypothetical protein